MRMAHNGVCVDSRYRKEVRLCWEFVVGNVIVQHSHSIISIREITHVIFDDKNDVCKNKHHSIAARIRLSDYAS